MGVPPVERSVAMQVCPYTVSTGRANRASSSGPVCTHLVSPAMLMWPVEMLPPPYAMALLQVLQAKSTEGHAWGCSRSGSSERALYRSWHHATSDEGYGTSLGCAMSTLVVQERRLWLCLIDIGCQQSLVPQGSCVPDWPLRRRNR